jgi:hypothetical protein
MAQPVLHADAQDLSRAVGGAILYQNETPYITSTQIQNATNVADLKTAVDNFAGHSDQIGLKDPLKRALDLGKDDTSLSDTNVQAATSAATLAANTYGDPTKRGPCDLK